jgi:hypothetical protein
MLRRVALAKTVIIKVTGISKQVLLRSLFRLLVTANVVPTSPILVTLMMEVLLSSETSVLTRVTRLNISEDDILLALKLVASLASFSTLK